MRILTLTYNVDYYCPCICIWTVVSTCYTIMYNDNNGMYHEARHELYYTGNTVIVAFSSI